MLHIDALTGQEIVVGPAQDRHLVIALPFDGLLNRPIRMAFIRAFIPFIQADLDVGRHLPDHPRCAQNGLIAHAAGQATEDMQDAIAGGHNLGLDGVVVLFTTVAQFAIKLIFGLGNALLGGIQEDFLNLGMGLEEFL